MKLQETIRDHEQRLRLVSFEVRESLGGWQAITKYRDALGGPWGIGCDVDMAVSLEKALVAGEHEMTVMRRGYGQTTWTPEMRLIEPLESVGAFEDLLG